MKIISNPNLPSNSVMYAIIGDNNETTEKALKKYGVKVLKISPRTNVLQGIQNHADLYFCHLNDDIAIVSKGQNELRDKLYDFGFSKVIICDKDLDKEYPNDVLLNCVFLKDYVIYNPKTISAEINNFIDKSNLIPVIVNQGYTKCSIAIVSDDAIITEDVSIGSRAAEAGMHVLVIDKGYVKLNGFNYGFIGGCCGKIAKDVLAFNGNIKKHPNYKEIKKFLNAHGVIPLSLHKGELEDIGSILPIIEK